MTWEKSCDIILVCQIRQRFNMQCDYNDAIHIGEQSKKNGSSSGYTRQFSLVD